MLLEKLLFFFSFVFVLYNQGGAAKIKRDLLLEVNLENALDAYEIYDKHLDLVLAPGGLDDETHLKEVLMMTSEAVYYLPSFDYTFFKDFELADQIALLVYGNKTFLAESVVGRLCTAGLRDIKIPFNPIEVDKTLKERDMFVYTKILFRAYTLPALPEEQSQKLYQKILTLFIKLRDHYLKKSKDLEHLRQVHLETKVPIPEIIRYYESAARLLYVYKLVADGTFAKKSKEEYWTPAQTILKALCTFDTVMLSESERKAVHSSNLFKLLDAEFLKFSKASTLSALHIGAGTIILFLLKPYVTN